MNTRALSCTLAGAAVGAAALFALASLPRTEPPIPSRVANSVTSFATDHPEWAVLRDSRVDATLLQMGHARHMQPDLRDGPLTCVSCHVTDESGRYMRPIQFEAHCARCHEKDLGWIDVAPGILEKIAAPHGSVADVLAAIDDRLNAMVAAAPDRFALKPAGTEAEEPAPAAPSRSRSDDDEDAPPPPLEIPLFTTSEERSAWLETQRVDAIAQVKGKCQVCHVAASTSTQAGAWTIAAPSIPQRWLPRSHYSHVAHGMLSCDQCHAARTSDSTGDILMPGINSCRECHQPHTSGMGGAPTDCVLCHTYHAPAPVHEGALKITDLGESTRPTKAAQTTAAP